MDMVDGFKPQVIEDEEGEASTLDVATPQIKQIMDRQLLLKRCLHLVLQMLKLATESRVPSVAVFLALRRSCEAKYSSCMIPSTGIYLLRVYLGPYMLLLCYFDRAPTDSHHQPVG